MQLSMQQVAFTVKLAKKLIDEKEKHIVKGLEHNLDYPNTINYSDVCNEITEAKLFLIAASDFVENHG